MRKEDSFDADFCPYYDIRLFLRSIVSIAHKQEHAVHEADHYAAQLNKMRKRAEVIVRNLERFSQEHSTYSLIHMENVGDIHGLYLFSDYQSASAEHRKLQDALKNFVNAGRAFEEELDGQASAKQKRLRPPYPRGDVWRQTFVECLGRYFYFLTETMPQADNKFLEFANSAYQSVLGGKKSLKAPIQTVVRRVKKMPTWAQFDRDGTKRPCLAHLPASPNSVVRGTAEWRERWQLVIRLAARGHAAADAMLSRGREFEGKALHELILEERESAIQ
jgi:hypothetical protein